MPFKVQKFRKAKLLLSLFSCRKARSNSPVADRIVKQSPSLQVLPFCISYYCCCCYLYL